MRVLTQAIRSAAILLVIGVFVASPASAGPAFDAIEKLARQAEPILNDADMAATTRAEKLQEVLASLIDSKQMAQSILGRHWRRADDAQKEELTDLLGRYLIFVYASRVDSVAGEVTFKVDGERATGERSLVDTRVLRPGEPSVAVAWQLENVDGAAKVTDILVEGVSLIVSQRADFSSVIRNQGGIPGLIDLLRNKLDS